MTAPARDCFAKSARNDGRAARNDWFNHCERSNPLNGVRRRGAAHDGHQGEPVCRAPMPIVPRSRPSPGDPCASARRPIGIPAERQPTCRAPIRACANRDPSSSIPGPRPRHMRVAARRPHAAQAGGRFQSRFRHVPVPPPAVTLRPSRELQTTARQNAKSSLGPFPL